MCSKSFSNSCLLSNIFLQRHSTLRFCLQNFDSSIFAVFPVTGLLMKYLAHTSRKISYQSIALFCDIFVCSAATVTLVWMDHKNISSMIVANESFDLLKKLSLRMVITAWQPLRGHRHTRVFFFTIRQLESHLLQSRVEAKRPFLCSQCTRSSSDCSSSVTSSLYVQFLGVVERRTVGAAVWAVVAIDWRFRIQFDYGLWMCVSLFMYHGPVQ